MRVLNNLVVNGTFTIEKMEASEINLTDNIKFGNQNLIDSNKNGYFNVIDVSSIKLNGSDFITNTRDINANSILCNFINTDTIQVNNPFILDTIVATSVQVSNVEVIDSNLNIKNINTLSVTNGIECNTIRANNYTIDGVNILESNRVLKNIVNQFANFNEESVDFGTITDKDTYTANLLRNGNVVSVSLRSFSRTANWTINNDGTFNKSIVLGKLPTNYAPTSNVYTTVVVSDATDSDIDVGLITCVIKTNGTISLRSFIPAKSYEEKVSINQESTLYLNTSFITVNSN